MDNRTLGEKSVRAGEVIRRFTAKDGKEVILRTPRWEDLDDLLEYINSLVDEGADIMMDQKTTREQEAEWLGRKLVLPDKGEEFSLVAEVDGKVVANSAVTKKKGRQKHVGGLGIAIREDYRDVGIGTEMMRTLIAQAGKMGLELLVLCIFSTNKRAIHVYEKAGFREVGRIPRGLCKDGKYVDEITMSREL